ncbi:hypothetical protein [Mucilaginibacter sp.]|uniref:hypothetical protein n=1 Tax=Mucilaginibacter sp. TaxID=1882438 RepID=UPI0025E218EF|nr:hypothetical protein [Mucilaginibacter sp.]
MFGISTRIKTTAVTPEMLAAWQSEHGSKMTVLEANNKKAYVREPTEKEVFKIVKKLTKSGKLKLDETMYLRKVIEVGWLGGDTELLTDKAIVDLNKKIWLT